MEPGAWAEIEDILAEAMDAETGARAALLARRCGGRPEVLAEVESLLAAHDRASRFLEPGAARPAVESSDEIGALIDGYRLVAPIGQGGMGDVYRAERADGTFAHAVAIKIGRATLGGRDAARRFQAEQQILAALHHPHIVTLFDGGTLPDGRPYFVMELVDGVPVTRYCRDAALDLDARLRLFRLVCAAVQHAHRHSVVHRDLKPANILVTTDGVPKVLDFGIAKLLDSPEGSANPTLTGPWSGPLTPNYASPEQLRGLAVTTASDIYALGVLLFELAAGVRPYEAERKPLDEVLDLVVRGDTPRPSATAAARGAAPAERRRLRGDLDAIVLKAMHKEPARRYGSAEELAGDIGRFLDGRPVVAREPSFGYLAWTLTKRHTAAVALAGIALVAVLTALGAALWQRQIAVRERARAERNFAETRQIANTLLFKIHDAIVPLAGSTPVRKTIADEATRYLARLEADSGRDPALRLELSRAYARLGAVLGNPSTPNLGDHAGALEKLRRARDLLLPLAAPADAPDDVLTSLVDVDTLLATVLQSAGSEGASEARTMSAEAVATAERLVRRSPSEERFRSQLGSAVFNRAIVDAGSKASLPHWQRALEIYGSLLADRPDDPKRQRNVALVHKYIGGVYDHAQEVDEAGRHYQRALELDERLLAQQPDSRQAKFDVAIDLANTGTSAAKQGNHRRSIAAFERSLRLRQELAASDPDDVLARSRLGSLHYRLAFQYQAVGDLTRARALLDRGVALLEASLQGNSHRYVQGELAWALAQSGHLARAEGNRARACADFERAQQEFDRLRQAGPLAPHRDEAAGGVASALRACRA